MAYVRPRGRASAASLREEISRLVADSFIDRLLERDEGMLAVLNEHRQILSVSRRLFQVCSVDGRGPILGLRPGEALGCTCATDHPDGCGSGRLCASCGAAVAIVVSQRSGAAGARDCIIDCVIGGVPTTLYLRVEASEVRIGGSSFTLLFLDDRTFERQRAAFERVLKDEIEPLVTGLLRAVGHGRSSPSDPDLSRPTLSTMEVERLARRLDGTLRVQSILDRGHAHPGATPHAVSFDLGSFVSRLADDLREHAAAEQRTVDLELPAQPLQLATDEELLWQALRHMVVNALEATPRHGHVRLGVSAHGSEVVLAASNPGAIPSSVQPRVFQRYFTTKPGLARGHGTFTMKRIVEDCLGGRVDFTSCEQDGTTFRMRLPRLVGRAEVP